MQVFEYLTVFSPAQKETLNKELKSTDGGKTTDQSLFDISKKKEQINKACYDGYYLEDEKYTYEYYNENYEK